MESLPKLAPCITIAFIAFDICWTLVDKPLATASVSEDVCQQCQTWVNLYNWIQYSKTFRCSPLCKEIMWVSAILFYVTEELIIMSISSRHFSLGNVSLDVQGSKKTEKKSTGFIQFNSDCSNLPGPLKKGRAIGSWRQPRSDRIPPIFLYKVFFILLKLFYWSILTIFYKM